MVDKLVKTLGGLNILSFPTSGEASVISKKEKMVTCALAADLLIGLRSSSVPSLTVLLSHTVETLIGMCDDADSDVRMVADESLNRIIRSLSDSNMLKLQIDLHTELKKNKSARCLRTALWKFAQLAHYIRPQKGRGHVQKLITSLTVIAKHKDESVHETLSQSFSLIFKTLGVYVSDSEVKELLHLFVDNLSSPSAVVRRSSSTCMISLVQECRKPHVFAMLLLNMLLDLILPVEDNSSVYSIQGVLTCVRMLIPCLVKSGDKNTEDEGLGGSFGLRKKQGENMSLSVDRLIQVYELCLHYCSHSDHNVVTCALETLNQLLNTPTENLKRVLTSCTGILTSQVNKHKENKLAGTRSRTMSFVGLSPGESSMNCSVIEDDLFDEPETPWSILDQSEVRDVDSGDAQHQQFTFADEDIKLISNPFQNKSEGDCDSDGGDSTFCSLTVTPTSTVRIDDIVRSTSSPLVRSNSHNSRDELDSIADVIACQLDIGSFTDADVPLLYCSRLLASRFLLDGSCGRLKPDRIVRVSIKSLALSCFSQIVSMCPAVIKLKLSANDPDCKQTLTDILLYSQHTDPQLRGVCCQIICCYISSSLNESRGDYERWIKNIDDQLVLQHLTGVVLKGLQDDSSVCCRLTLNTSASLLISLLSSRHKELSLPILKQLISLVNNNYWLVKVKLLEIISELDFLTINDLIGGNKYQNDVLDKILLVLMEDVDQRVRSSAAEAVVRIIPKLYYSEWTVLKYCQDRSYNFNNYLDVDVVRVSNSVYLYSPYNVLSQTCDDNNSISLQSALSRIVTRLSRQLLVADNKHTFYGCIETLTMLSNKYSPVRYTTCWNMSNCLFNYLISLLTTSPDLLNLSALTNVTNLITNLFAGQTVCYLKPSQGVNLSLPVPDSGKLWDMFDNTQLSEQCEILLTHTMKMLNIYCHVLDNVPLSKSQLHTTANLLQLNISSPIRRNVVEDDVKVKQQQQQSAKSTTTTHQHTSELQHNNTWQNNYFYFKLYQLIKSAHGNYKISLDRGATDNLLDLLESTLKCVSALLEVATMRESGRLIEEILCYLKCVVGVKPCTSVTCVVQLLKSLFSSNLSANWTRPSDKTNVTNCQTLYGCLLQVPLQNISEIVKSHHKIATSSSSVIQDMSDVGNNKTLFKRNDWKLPLKVADKNSLASYIKLFEPMVICALKQYTISGDVNLQCNVLQLLCQLVRLRVNYCLLDAENIFISFVLKQFASIEQGQTKHTDKLLMDMFKFLIHLSYEKNHSKSIISIPKLLQLCDGLMASGQSPLTHCIPALIPIVEDVFLSRGGGVSATTAQTTTEHEELETQKEFLLAMLLRLAEFEPVLDLLTLILTECRHGESLDKWKKLSRTIIEVVLPLVKTGRLRVETSCSQQRFNKLLNSVAPSALRPVDPLLSVLFSEPRDLSGVTLERWLGGVTIVLLHLLHIKEDVLLNRLEDVYTPQQQQEPAYVFTNFMFDLLRQLGYNMSQSDTNNLHEILQLFLLCLIYLVESGKFHRIANTMEEYLTSETSSMVSLNETYINLTDRYPVLTILYNYLLTLLNSSLDMYMLMSAITQDCLHNKLIKFFSIINVLHYLCDNMGDVETLKHILVTNITEVIMLSDETPARELLSLISRKPAEGNLLLQTISTRCGEQTDCKFTEKLLRCVENVDLSQSGALVFVLVKKFICLKHLSLVRLSTSIISRRLEFLLTLPPDKVIQQLDPDMFDCVVQFFKQNQLFQRHLRLVSLLNKLGQNVYNKQITDVELEQNIDVDQVKSVRVDGKWFFSQVKHRCCRDMNTGPETAVLLAQLSRDQILEVMSCKEFNLNLLEDCLVVGAKRYIATRGRNKHGSDSDTENSTLDYREEISLYLASRECLLTLVDEIVKLMPRQHRVCRTSTEDTEYRSKLLELCEDNTFTKTLWRVTTCVTVFVNVLVEEMLNDELSGSGLENIVKFSVFLLEIVNCINVKTVGNRRVENCLQCLQAVYSYEPALCCLSQNVFRTMFDSLIMNLCSLSWSVCDDEEQSTDNIEQDFEMLSRLLKQSEKNLNKLQIGVRSVTLTLCRTSYVSSNLVKVPETLDVQDINTIQELVSYMSLTGWSTRHQFEEMWACLLTVLGFNDQLDNNEDLNYFLQIASVAVDGITTLLSKAMLQHGRYLHHCRDSTSLHLYSCFIQQQTQVLSFDKFGFLFADLETNLEFISTEHRYRIGQLSVEYIWSSLNTMNCNVKQQQQDKLDLDSCLHLLLDIYSQWLQQYKHDIRIITSCLTSAIVLSDLFTDVSQYLWLYDYCMTVEEVVNCCEDKSLLPQFIVGCCKSVAVTLPDMEACEKVKKLLVRANTIPSQTAVVKGLLYLVQSHVVCRQNSLECESGNNICVMFLPIVLEIIQEFKSNRCKDNIEYEVCCWSLIFYMLEHYTSTLSTNTCSELITWIVNIVRSNSHSPVVVDVLIKGLERLVISNSLSKVELDQIMKTVLERISHQTVNISQSGLRLLVSIIYTEYVKKDKVDVEEEDTMMKKMEVVNVLFERLRRSYRNEAEVLANVLTIVLLQLDPSEILTKVIQEFLSPHQPHLNILSLLIFKVFERTELTLLEDWVVFSLPSFVQGMSIAMSIWTLSVFFVSSSCHSWLRAMFPLVQARVRCFDAQDKTLLCVSARHFYNQLKKEKQKEMFYKTFQNAANNNSLFNDVLQCLN